MAITIDDFSKIWASTSPLTPYDFSDDNYKQGWNFVGATPPSRQMWDSIQKSNDEKLKYLLDNFADYLPLAGGTMGGDIAMSGSAIKNVDDISYTDVYGGTSSNGSYLRLRGKDSSGFAGNFSLQASDGVDSAVLLGTPTESLTWANKEVERVNASGADYIRYESGLQICWGNEGGVTTSGKAITYPVAFKDTNYRIITGSTGYIVSASGTGYSGRTNTGCNLTCGSTTGASVDYIAVGYWK